MDGDYRELIISDNNDAVVIEESDGTPVGWFKQTLSLPNGQSLPIIAAIERRMGLTTKFILCSGTDSPCSSQCSLKEERQELFRGRPCPLEVQAAHDILVGLAKELELKAFEQTGVHYDLNGVLEEIAQLSMIGEYLMWELIGFRADMELAKNVSVLGEKLVEARSGRIFKEKVVHPLVEIKEKATKAKIALQREFLTTKKGRLERLAKESQVTSSVAKLLSTIRERLPAEEVKQIEEQRSGNG